MNDNNPSAHMKLIATPMQIAALACWTGAALGLLLMAYRLHKDKL